MITGSEALEVRAMKTQNGTKKKRSNLTSNRRAARDCSSRNAARRIDSARRSGPAMGLSLDASTVSFCGIAGEDGEITFALVLCQDVSGPSWASHEWAE